jgi:hypothetical protein
MFADHVANVSSTHGKTKKSRQPKLGHYIGKEIVQSATPPPVPNLPKDLGGTIKPLASHPIDRHGKDHKKQEPQGCTDASKKSTLEGGTSYVKRQRIAQQKLELVGYEEQMKIAAANEDTSVPELSGPNNGPLPQDRTESSSLADSAFEFGTDDTPEAVGAIAINHDRQADIRYHPSQSEDPKSSAASIIVDEDEDEDERNMDQYHSFLTENYRHSHFDLMSLSDLGSPESTSFGVDKASAFVKSQSFQAFPSIPKKITGFSPTIPHKKARRSSTSPRSSSQETSPLASPAVVAKGRPRSNSRQGENKLSKAERVLGASRPFGPKQVDGSGYILVARERRPSITQSDQPVIPRFSKDANDSIVQPSAPDVVGRDTYLSLGIGLSQRDLSKDVENQPRVLPNQEDDEKPHDSDSESRTNYNDENIPAVPARHQRRPSGGLIRVQTDTTRPVHGNQARVTATFAEVKGIAAVDGTESVDGQVLGLLKHSGIDSTSTVSNSSIDPAHDLSFLPELKHQSLVRPSRLSQLGPPPLVPRSLAQPTSSPRPLSEVRTSPREKVLSPTRPMSEATPTGMGIGSSGLNIGPLMRPRGLGAPISGRKKPLTSYKVGMAPPQEPIFKFFVVCCQCERYHDMPSKIYEAMSMKRKIKENELHGIKKEGELETRVKCAWCTHNMSSSCCSGWAADLVLKERLH